MCQTVAPHQCLNALQLSSTRMPAITYTPDHARKHDRVSSRLTVVQTGNDARFAGFHAHGDKQSMAAAICGSPAVTEGCLGKQHTSVLRLVLKHDFKENCVKLLHHIRVGGVKANPNWSDSSTEDVVHVKLADIYAQ